MIELHKYTKLTASKDVLLDRIEHEYLFYISNLVFIVVF